MMFIATSLSYYKRLDIRKALVAQAQDKEVSVMFSGGRFGKRPDVLVYDNDVLDFAKKKATSFHCSEELWENPLAIVTGMARKDLDELRVGWDLILDIDCPDWDFSKMITHLFIRALQDHGISAVTAKFSGNKGFHIAVPFEAFPEFVPFRNEEDEIAKREVKDLFPEAPRKIATYLLGFITQRYVEIVDDGVRADGHFFSFEKLQEISSHSAQELLGYQCSDCRNILPVDFQKPRQVYSCEKCGHESRPKGFPDVIRCERCSHPVQGRVEKSGCPRCSSTAPPRRVLNLSSVIEVDTILISSRHLYRMPYSLHEKSGLVSVPVDPARVLDFDKKSAKPDAVSFDFPFLDRLAAKSGEAANLFLEAFDKTSSIHEGNIALRQEIPIPEDAIAVDFFPPCILNILKGMQDGKKRALFILINFLRVSGWSREQIKELVYEWNSRNDPPLREQYIKGQLFQIKKGKSALPPPNCANQDYYKSLLICTPDSFCPRIKNPAMYAKRRQELGKKAEKKNKNPSKKVKKTK